MLTLDRGHLAQTHRAAVEQDASLRAWDREIARGADAAGSIDELVRLLRGQGDYWDRVQAGRFRTAKRLLGRLVRPFFRAQIRYNLLVAEHLCRIDAALAELRRAAEAEPGPESRDQPAHRGR